MDKTSDDSKPMDGEVASLISPDGECVQTADHFLSPEEIVVSQHGVSFDGWVLRFDQGISEADIAWLIDQTRHLCKSLGPERAMGVLEAIQTVVTGFPQQLGTDNATVGRNHSPSAAFIKFDRCSVSQVGREIGRQT